VNAMVKHLPDTPTIRRTISPAAARRLGRKCAEEAIAQCTSDEQLRELDVGAWQPTAADYAYLHQFDSAPSQEALGGFQTGYQWRCQQEAKRLDEVKDGEP
jgi:hypothetical protein